VDKRRESARVLLAFALLSLTTLVCAPTGLASAPFNEFSDLLTSYSGVADEQAQADGDNTIFKTYCREDQFETGVRLLREQFDRTVDSRQRRKIRIRQADCYYAWGEVLADQSKTEAALDKLELAYRSDRENRPLNAGYEHLRMGRALNDAGEFQRAAGHFGAALQIFRQQRSTLGRAYAFNGLGEAYYHLGLHQRSITVSQMAFELFRIAKNLNGEGYALSGLSLAYVALSRNTEAVRCLQQAIARFQKTGNQAGEAGSRNSLGFVYTSLNRPKLAILQLERALRLYRRLGNQTGEAMALAGTADLYASIGQPQSALDNLLPAIEVFNKLNNKQAEANALVTAASVYQTLGDFANAVSFYLRAANLSHSLNAKVTEANALNQLGGCYYFLSQYAKALQALSSALTLFRNLGQREGQAFTLGYLGYTYHEMGDDTKANSILTEALQVFRAVGDRRGEAGTLTALADIHTSHGRPEEALPLLTRSLALQREIQNREGEAWALHTLGRAHLAAGNLDAARQSLIEAFTIFRETKAELGTANVLAELMILSRKFGRLELAIFWGKQAINAFQRIRQNVIQLDKETLTRFTNSRAPVYRNLADALIEAGRLAEAEIVLRLLKDEEYSEYLRASPQDTATAGAIGLQSQEAEWDRQYRAIADQLVAIGSRRGDLLLKGRTLTAGDEAALNRIEEQLRVGQAAFERFLAALTKEPAGSTRPEKLRDVREARALMEDLRELRGRTVLIYTLVGESRFRSILVTPDVEKAYEFPITSVELNRLVVSLREAVQSPASDPVQSARRLYEILVAPLAQDLTQYGADTLVWELDGVLRYVPLAALHDGRQFLVERYRLAVFTPASVARIKERPLSSWTGAGFGVSKAHEGAPALNNVVAELEAIIRRPGSSSGIIPGEIKLDEEFTAEEMRATLHRRFPVVHFATHFKFAPGSESDSFLMLGDGSHLTLSAMKTFPNLFGGVELLTLSACETGVGDNAGEGIEVESFGMLAQRQGAKAVLASLWSVPDAGTRSLMTEFYRRREAQPELPKVEALRQAQLALIHGQVAPPDGQKDRGVKLDERPERPSAPGFTHPFYWAAFFLIGNWQ
jgi:CHAT domain-containing protein